MLTSHPVRLRIGLILGLLLTLAPIAAAENNDSVSRLRKDLTYLSSDECEGRGAETQGIFKAANYIVAEYEQLGLKPGGMNGSYFQPFSMRSGKAVMDAGNRLMLKGPLGQGIELQVDKNFRPLGMSAMGKAAGPLVFVGYGLSEKDIGFDEYKGLDVAGKIVVVLRKTPPTDPDGKPFAGGRGNQLGSLQGKLLTAKQKKAAGVLFVNDRDTAKRVDALMTFDYLSQQEPVVDLPTAHILRSQLNSMLQSSIGASLEDIERDIDREVKPHSVPLTGWTASLDTRVIRKTVMVKNIIGVLEGKGPLAKEIVVIGAHYDHLGRGERGSLERDPKRQHMIHHGADDNGSGTVSVIELARRFASRKDYQGRTIVFMNFAGEEQGLLGSRYFCGHPTISLDHVCAMVNLDMVGRLRSDEGSTQGKLEIGGIGSARSFDAMVDELNKSFGFKLAKTKSAYGPSDHTSFAEKNIPVFFLFTGLHAQYHKPADTVDTINFDGMKKIVDFTQELVSKLAALPEKPQFVQTSRGSLSGARTSVPRIGFMPGNYDESTSKGVLIGGVTEGGPAAKAGVKKGDFIVEIAGKPIKNMTAYMTVMAEQKKGQPIEMIVERGGKRIKLSVKGE